MKTTIKDMAKMIGISEAAVSMALNDKKGVSEETRRQVKDLAIKYNYMPDAIARSLVKKRSKMIGLVVPDIENPYYSKMVRCVENSLRGAGYSLNLAISDENIVFEKEIINRFISSQVEGIIISPVNKVYRDLSHYDLLIKRKIPAVFIAAKYQVPEIPFVMMNLEVGTYKLVDYLLKIGNRDIVFLTGPREIAAFGDRINGYKKAYKDNGIEYNESNFVTCSRVDFEQAYFATMQLIKSDRNVDTIISANDYMAMGILKALYESGIKVPKDISVAGYDDIIYASIANVPITTVVQDIEKMSQVSTDTILHMITQTSSYQPENIYIDSVLVVRESTAPRMR